MFVKVLGTGDAFSTERYNASFVVSQGNFSVAIDCPHPYLRILNELYEDPVCEINDIIITHLHGDHISGLDTFLFYKRFVENVIVNVYCNQHEELWQHLKPSMGKSFDQEFTKDFFYNSLPIGGQCGPFTIECRETKHYILSNAILIRKDNESVGFSSDTAFDPKLIEWLCQASLVFHEIGLPPGHTSYSMLFKKLKDLNTLGKVRIAHFPDHSEQIESEMSHIRNEVRKYQCDDDRLYISQILTAEEGELFDLGDNYF